MLPVIMASSNLEKTKFASWIPKKRIALIARGFGPVVAKPPLEEIPEKTPEATNEQTANEAP